MSLAVCIYLALGQAVANDQIYRSNNMTWTATTRFSSFIVTTKHNHASWSLFLQIQRDEEKVESTTILQSRNPDMFL